METWLDYMHPEREIRQVKCSLITWTNTWFKKPKRQMYTWKASGYRNQHQLVYILMKHQLINSNKHVQTLPGADTDSDHNLLIAKICTKLKKTARFQKRKPR
jgi:hypothetical protein